MAHIADFIDITGTDAFLNIGQTGSLRVLLAQQIGNERMHTGGGEQYGGVILRDNTGGGDDTVALFLEELQEQRAQFVAGQLLHVDAPFQYKNVPVRSKTNRHNSRYHFD